MRASRGDDEGAERINLNLILATFVGAFVDGDVLQVLVIALLFGFALAAVGEKE